MTASEYLLLIPALLVLLQGIAGLLAPARVEAVQRRLATCFSARWGTLAPSDPSTVRIAAIVEVAVGALLLGTFFLTFVPE